MEGWNHNILGRKPLTRSIFIWRHTGTQDKGRAIYMHVTIGIRTHDFIVQKIGWSIYIKRHRSGILFNIRHFQLVLILFIHLYINFISLYFYLSKQNTFLHKLSRCWNFGNLEGQYTVTVILPECLFDRHHVVLKFTL